METNKQLAYIMYEKCHNEDLTQADSIKFIETELQSRSHISRDKLVKLSHDVYKSVMLERDFNVDHWIAKNL